MVLFISFACLIMFSLREYCNSLRDFYVSSLRASSSLPVFSCIFLREVFLSVLKPSVIVMRSNFRFKSCFSGVMVYPGLAMVGNWVLMMPNNLGFCCLCSPVFL